MAHAQTSEPVSINIRAKAKQRDLIDQAADRLGRSRSDFMLEVSCREAQDVLLDQVLFTVDSGTFAKFQKLMDLGIIEVSWYSNNCMGNLLSQIRLSSLLHFSENHGRNFFWGKCLGLPTSNINLNVRFSFLFNHLEWQELDVLLHRRVIPSASDEALGIEDRVLGVGRELVLGRIANQTLPFRSEGHIRRRDAVALIVGYDLHAAVLEHTDAGIGGPQVDADHRAHILLLVLLLGPHRAQQQQRRRHHSELMELHRCLGEEFGHPSLPTLDFWETDPNLGQVSAALTRAAQAPQLPLDLHISNETYPFVMEYCPNGRPLLPLAFALDLLSHAVGGQAPLALEKVALRRDVQIQDETLIRLTRNEDEVRLLELKGPREVVAFSARVGKLEPTPAVLPLASETHPTSLSVAAFYRDVAFQGPLLHGILEIESEGKSSLRGTVKTSTPQDFLPGDPRKEWTIDPLLIDSALQMAVYWSHVERGKLAVAQEIQRIVWLQQPAPGKVQVQWRMISENENEILSTAQFVQDGRPLGWLEGVKSRLEVPRSKVIEGQSLETLPGYVELQRRMKAAKERGFSIPYFQMHDEVKGVHSQIHGRDLVNFSSYNYVGLSGHPQVTAASIAATERFGTSVSASRLVAGERPPHRSLERKIADFLGTEDALVLVSGYLTNVTIISHLMSAGDLILYDSYSHDCILKGVRASGATRQAFPHNDMDVLEERLSRIRRSFGRVLVVVEGVYSMDGDFPDLARLVELRDKYNFWLLIDEAHSLGTMGQTGRGLGEHYGVARHQVDLWTGTLSKALASCGGYVAGRQELIEYLKYTTPGFVYSVGMPPSNAAAAQAALEILQREPERVRDLQAKSAFFLDQIRKQGLDSGLAQGTPVVPVILGDSAVAWELARELAVRGITTCPIVYPAVEEKSARLRFFITNLHTIEQLEYAARATAECLADLTVTAGARI